MNKHKNKTAILMKFLKTKIITINSPKFSINFASNLYAKSPTTFLTYFQNFLPILNTSGAQIYSSLHLGLLLPFFKFRRVANFKYCNQE